MCLSYNHLIIYKTTYYMLIDNAILITHYIALFYHFFYFILFITDGSSVLHPLAKLNYSPFHRFQIALSHLFITAILFSFIRILKVIIN